MSANDQPLNTVTEQQERNSAQQPAKRIFLVLFEDRGTEIEKIISDNAQHFYNFCQEQFELLESCEVEGSEGDEQPKIETSGVKALAVFEVPDKLDLSELQTLSVSHYLLPALLKDAVTKAKPEEKSLTASQG